MHINKESMNTSYICVCMCIYIKQILCARYIAVGLMNNKHSAQNAFVQSNIKLI